MNPLHVRIRPSPLAGRLFDENGEPLYAQGATKGGRRYRYYVSRDLVRGSAEQGQGGWRVPAPEIERAVIGAAQGTLDDKPAILAAIQASAIDAPDINHIFAITSDWSERLLTETETAAAVVEVIERVQLKEDGIRVVLRIPIPSGQMISETTARVLRVSRFVPMKVKRRGVEMRIILNYKDERYVTRVIRLAFIAPAIVDMVAEGRAPAGLNLQMLMDSRVKLPMEWTDQERVLELEA